MKTYEATATRWCCSSAKRRESERSDKRQGVYQADIKTFSKSVIKASDREEQEWSETQSLKMAGGRLSRAGN